MKAPGRVAFLLAAILLASVPVVTEAGTFVMQSVYYETQTNLGTTRVMVGAHAQYVGLVDSNDNYWAIETSLTHQGTTFKNGSTGGSGITPNKIVTCEATSCGAFADIESCTPTGGNQVYSGQGVVAIYHQYAPEIDTMTAPSGQTACDGSGGGGGGPEGGGTSSPPGDGSGNCSAEGCTPILIDLDRGGFDLSDLEGGTRFDVDRDGIAEAVSWTRSGGGDAWLALDRNGNGTIDDGGELFGNFTDQPSSPEPNGYRALAVFDDDGDGKLSAADGIFSALRLWTDRNQDGVSQPFELSTLAAAGVQWLGLDPVESRHRDRYGNEFRFKAPVRLHLGMTQSVDVFLLTSP